MGFMGQPKGTGLGAWRPRVITRKILEAVSVLVSAVYLQDGNGTAKVDVVTLGALNILPIAIYDDSGVQTGLAGNALRVDPTGTTTQPVSGTITANAGTNLNTSALLAENTFTGRIGEVQAAPTANTLLARLKAIADAQLPDNHNVTVDNASIAVTGTFYQGTQPVSGTFWQTTQPISIDQTGNNNAVDVLTIAAGDNNIGNVDIVTVPADPFGVNADAAAADGSISAKLKFLTSNGIAGMTSLPAGSNAIGKLAANTGVDIGDVDVTSLPTIPAGTNIIGAVKIDKTNYTPVSKYAALANTDETTVWDPTGGTKFVITDIFISVDAAATVTLRDGTAGSTVLIADLAAQGGFVTNLRTPIQSATADNILTAQTDAANAYVTVCGYEV